MTAASDLCGARVGLLWVWGWVFLFYGSRGQATFLPRLVASLHHEFLSTSSGSIFNIIDRLCSALTGCARVEASPTGTWWKRYPFPATLASVAKSILGHPQGFQILGGVKTMCPIIPLCCLPCFVAYRPQTKLAHRYTRPLRTPFSRKTPLSRTLFLRENSSFRTPFRAPLFV